MRPRRHQHGIQINFVRPSSTQWGFAARAQRARQRAPDLHAPLMPTLTSSAARTTTAVRREGRPLATTDEQTAGASRAMAGAELVVLWG
jgi:hypothetical protein